MGGRALARSRAPVSKDPRRDQCEHRNDHSGGAGASSRRGWLPGSSRTTTWRRPMNGTDRVRIAMQKKGRLADRSMELLRKCGIDVDWRADQLICSSVNLPLDVMLV